MQSVGYLNQHNANIVGDGEQQFAEILRLLAGLLAEYTARNLRQSVHYLGYLVAEKVAYIVGGIVGIFHHVVEQCAADTGAAETYFLYADTRHCQRVHDIRLAAQAADTFVCLLGKMKSMRDQFHLLAVHRMGIIVQQRLELVLDHLLFFLCKLAFCHCTEKVCKITKTISYMQTRPRFLF